MNKKSKTQDTETWNYEAAVAKVEAAIAQIESGNLQLAEVFDRFSTALEHLNQCEAFLAQRQEQIDVLIETLEDNPEPF